MVKFDVEGSQNVEVSEKIPCEKSLVRQLEIMEEYTAVHKKFSGASKERREVECLKVIFPHHKLNDIGRKLSIELRNDYSNQASGNYQQSSITYYQLKNDLGADCLLYTSVIFQRTIVNLL